MFRLQNAVTIRRKPRIVNDFLQKVALVQLNITYIVYPYLTMAAIR